MTMEVRNAAGEIEEIEKPLAPGRKPAEMSRPVVLSETDLAALQQIQQSITDLREDLQAGGPVGVALLEYTGAVLIAPGIPVTPGQGVFIACTEAGVVRLLLKDDSFLDVPVVVGSSMIDNLSVKDVVAGATTAAAAVSVLTRQ